MGFSLILRAFFGFPNECQFIECQFFGKFRYRKDPKAGDKETLKTLTAKTVVIKKQDIIKLLWMNKPIESINRDSLYRKYPIIHKLQICINEFRHIFIYKSIPRLYLFIERYKKSEYASIASFAKGLE